MARQKVYTYFNKNHITIQRIENPEYFDLADGEATYEEQITSNRTEIWANNWWDPGTKTVDSIRPWEVCPDDKGFSDNMLNSLVSDLNDFFDRMRVAGIDKVCRNSDRKFPGYRAYNVSEMQIEVNELMFGNRKGLRFQTDKEKIESHGFDTKYSFRKDKETK